MKLEYWKSKIAVNKNGKLVSRAMWFCHLKAANGEIILQSEGYVRVAGVKNLHRALTQVGAVIELKKLNR